MPGHETVTPGRPVAGSADAALGTPDATAVVLQAASLLLDYPSPASPEVTELIEAALGELPRSAARRRLDRFLSWWNELDEAAREQTYVATFDLDRGLTLYLTEGRHSTPRERGAALLDLRRAYRARRRRRELRRAARLPAADARSGGARTRRPRAARRGARGARRPRRAADGAREPLRPGSSPPSSRSCRPPPSTARGSAHERGQRLAGPRLRDPALPRPHRVRGGPHLALQVRPLRLDEPLLAALRAAPAAHRRAALPLRHAAGHPRPRDRSAAPQVVDHRPGRPGVAVLRVLQGRRDDGRRAHRHRSRGPDGAPPRAATGCAPSPRPSTGSRSPCSGS